MFQFRIVQRVLETDSPILDAVTNTFLYNYINEIIEKGEYKLTNQSKNESDVWPNVIVSVNKIDFQNPKTTMSPKKPINELDTTRGIISVTGNSANVAKFMKFYENWIEKLDLWVYTCTLT